MVYYKKKRKDRVYENGKDEDIERHGKEWK